jgi:hypothetical protein
MSQLTAKQRLSRRMAQIQSQRWSSAYTAGWASVVLKDRFSTPLDKRLAACVLSQRAENPRRSSLLMAALASAVLRSPYSSRLSKLLAGSVLSQR